MLSAARPDLMLFPGEDDLPHTDGEPMESWRHRLAMQMLIDPLESWLARQGRHDVFVAGNMAIYFSAQQARNNDFRAPDVFVVLNTTDRERKSWVVWHEDGKAPDVVVEILSESTASEDRGRKMWLYARTLKVPLYCLYDPFTGVLEGYGLDRETGGYLLLHDPEQPVPGPLGLELAIWEGTWRGITAPWLRWRARGGDWLSTNEDRDAQATSLVGQAELRANEAEARAEEAAAHAALVVAYAAEETARAEHEAARAEQAAARAEQEAARAKRLAAKLAALGLDADD